MNSPFPSTGHFETSAPNDQKWPEMTLNTTKSYVPHIYVTSIHKSRISRRFALRWLKYRSFGDKCTEWPQIEPYNVKSPYKYITTVPESQISRRCALRPAIFELRAILRQTNLPKIQNLKFHNSSYNFGGDPSYENAWLLGSMSVAYFQTRCRLKLFLPYGPMLRKTKKKLSKI